MGDYNRLVRCLWPTIGSVIAVLLQACSPPPTSIPVTLTPPIPTSTPKPVNLVPPMEVGVSYTYADGTALVAVPHGAFRMGHGKADNPEHSVTLSDYWIYSTEVTNVQYALCVRQGWCTPPDPGDDPDFQAFESLNRPVVGVTYDQAADYCAFMSAELPTEAQWEKAARSTDGRPYPWGDEQPGCKLLNFSSCLKHAADVTTNPEGTSPYGALNMAGNVYEWVADWYDPLYYESSPPGDPQGPASGRARVIRSSGYRSTADQSLSYARSFASPNDHRPDLGFRCAVTDVSALAPACVLAPSVGLSQMAAVTADCPELSIDVEVTACRYGGGAVVTFNDNQPRDPNASFGGIVGCTLLSGQPGSYPLSYSCRTASTAVLDSSCTYAGVPPGNCPSHFDLSASSNRCQWSGERTAGIDCPAGEFYDPALHCCRVTTGNLVDFPVCPVGQVFTETASETYSCIPAESARKAPQVTAAINPPSCGNICELTVELCSVRNLVFCPTTCACLAVGRKCPEQ